MKFIIRSNQLIGIILIMTTTFTSPQNAYPCSVFSFSANDVMVAKNLDWFSGEGRILINKRGVGKHAVLIDTRAALAWTSKYASITISGNGMDFPWEGFNEAGLSVNALQLLGSLAAPASNSVLTIGYVQWIQYILDTSSTVEEAIENASAIRISSGTTLHYFVCDSSADCATFEYINGSLTIHHGADLPIRALTNSTYEDSIAYYNSVAGMPANWILYSNWSADSLNRFARAALWSRNYPQTSKNPISHGFQGLYNLAQFIPATATSPGWQTYWSMVFDLTTKTLYWRTLASPDVKFVSLASFNQDCSSGVQGLDVNYPGVGDLADMFTKFTNESHAAAVDAWAQSLPTSHAPSSLVIDTIKSYPLSLNCLR